jgi:SAM-dependent methyltransferase
MSLGDAWEQHAHEWIAWARTSQHDGFQEGTWPQLRSVLPPPDGLVIEIGCGEGRVARQLTSLGHRVVGVELSSTLARAARSHDDVPVTVVQADASRLPMADAVATMVVACMSLHDVDDLSATVAEAARLLIPGGALCFAIVHPFATAQDSMSLRGDRPGFSQPYLRERRTVDRIERDGLVMTFESMHRPLSAYMETFADAGLCLRELREFGPRLIPWLLVARLEKLG